MSDPANFGMAKSLVMSGIEAGFDITSQAGTAAFIQHFNQSRQEPFRSSPFAASSNSAAAPFAPPITKDLKQRKKLLKKLKRK